MAERRNWILAGSRASTLAAAVFGAMARFVHGWFGIGKAAVMSLDELDVGKADSGERS